MPGEATLEIMTFLGLSRRAVRDIEEIRRDSVEQWGEGVAEEYLDSIEEGRLRLRENTNLLRIQAGVFLVQCH